MRTRSAIPFFPWLIAMILMPVILTVIQLMTRTIYSKDISNFFFSFLFIGTFFSSPALVSVLIRQQLFKPDLIPGVVQLLLTSVISTVLTSFHYLIWFRSALLNIEGIVLFTSYLIAYCIGFCLNHIFGRGSFIK